MENNKFDVFDQAYRQHLRRIVEAPAIDPPDWLPPLVAHECRMYGRPMPEVKAKVYPGAIPGGYTSWLGKDKGEVVIIGRDQLQLEEPNLKTFTDALHEITHWIVNIWDDVDGGHNHIFYRSLTERYLRWGLDVEELERQEFSYMGDNVIKGIELFDRRYNSERIRWSD